MTKPKYLIYLAIFISTWPFLYLLKNGISVPLIANLTGMLGVLLMVWQFILGNRFISVKLRENFIDNVKLHIFLGTYGLLFVFMHPFLEMISYAGDLSFVFVPKLDGTAFTLGVAHGRLAFYLLVIIWVTSALLRKKIAYRWWLKLHYINYVILGLVFLHARAIGTYTNNHPIIKNYWYLLMGVIVLGFIWRLAEYLNIFKYKYRLVSKSKLSSDVYNYKFRALNKHINPKPGQFAFLRKSFFSEAHPFTIRAFYSEEKVLQFSIKQVGKYTNNLPNLKKGDIVYIDGPYGVFTREGQNNNQKIIIAGGIGVTPFYELVSRFGDENTKFFYANRTVDEAVFRDEFKFKLKNNYIDILSQEKMTGKNIETGHLDKNIFNKYLDKGNIKTANVFLCGSPGFMNAVKSELNSFGVSSDRIYTEEFSL